MSDYGWVKIHRSLIDNPKLTRSSRLALWIYILLSVDHFGSKAFLGGKEIDLKPGQGIFSTPDLSRKLGESVSVIRRNLNWFESEQQIEQLKTSHGTVITVLNWDKYQNCEQPIEQPLNNRRTTTEQPQNNLPIIRECNNDNNDILNNNTNVLLFVQQELDDEPNSGKFKPIIDAWNSLPITPIRAIKGNRLDMVKARIKEYGLDSILTAIDKIKESPFLLGQNKQGWQATFDWFIRPNNFIKVLEGNYIRTAQPQGKNDVQTGYQKMMDILGGNNGED